MKLIKSLALLLVGSFLVVPAIATRFETSTSWGQSIDGDAWVEYSSDYSDETKIFRAKISHSTSGHQRIYFSNFYVAELNICKYKTSLSKSTTMIFDGQAVKMMSWCKKSGDSSHYYLELTPATDLGDSYIINLFKVSVSPIKIQYDNETLYFPVIGFTKAWNSAGGNAI